MPAVEVNENGTEANGRKNVSEFGSLMKEWRLRQQLTQASLAKAANISPGYVAMIELGDRGERPSMDVIRRIGRALNLDLDDMELLLQATRHLAPGQVLVPEKRITFPEYVDSDVSLSSSQKKILKALYTSWGYP